MRYTIFLTVLVTIFGMTSMWLAGVPLNLAAAAVFFGFALLSLWLGQICFISICKLDIKLGAVSGCFALGAVLLSVCLSILVAIFSIPLWVSAGACAAVTISLWFWLKPRELESNVGEEVALTLFSVVLLLLLASPIASPVILQQTGILPIWVDYYIHGATIYNFSSSFLLGQDMTIAGASRMFYHYGPFMLSALIQSATSISGLTASTSVLLPIGILIAMFGGVSLALSLGGLPLAFLSFLALIAVPGPETFGVKSGWFDFNWLLIASPGSGYAIGLGCVLLMLAHNVANSTQPKSQYWKILVLIFVGAAALILTRVHIFLLITPVLAAYIWLTWSSFMRRIAFIMACAGVIIIIAIFTFSESATSVWLDISQPHIYFSNVMNFSQYYGDLKASLGTNNFGLLLAFDLLITIGSTFGYWTILLPLLFGLTLWRRRLEHFDLVLPLLLITYIFLILFTPAGGNGDVTEYKHRHFVLIYILSTIIATHLFLRLIPNLSNNRGLTVAAAIGSLGCGLFMSGRMIDKPDLKVMPWADTFHNASITKNVPRAADYLSSHSNFGDLFALSTKHARNSFGPLTEIISLSGVPAYLGRTPIHSARSECMAATISLRLTILKNIEESKNWSEAREILRLHGIRWYLTFSNEAPLWSDGPGAKVLSLPGISIYDSEAAIQTKNLSIKC